MALRSKITGLGRFVRGVRGVIADRITVSDACVVIRHGVERRRERFLGMVGRAIGDHPDSPYQKLLDAAGCRLADLAALVDREGLEGALTILARAGVHVTYDEFKGRAPAVRGSQTFYFTPEDFDDPLSGGAVSATSGGTRGRPTRVPIDADLIAEMAPYWAIFLAEQGCMDAPLIFWTPGHAGVAARYLACAKAGQRYSDWFVSEPMRSISDRLYAASVHRLSRTVARLPRPTPAPFDEPGPVLQRTLDLLAEARPPAINTTPSAAVKLSIAAQSRGASLRGVTFLLGAEPLTPARRRAIEGSGARAAPLYGSTEAPWIGGQCRNALHADEVHVLLDSYAIVSEGSLLFTSLRPALPKVLLNVDIGDGAVMDEAPCDCQYGRLGCDVRLRAIRSTDKVTELGVTFAVQDVFHVLEDALPRRFGGAAGDYQLVEDRDANGLPRYTLAVSPRVPSFDDRELPAAFLREMGKLAGHYRVMAAAWARERMIHVERRSPIASAAGKILPFHRTPE